MDRMTEQAGGPLTFGDIRRQEEAAAAAAAAANESNEQPERWFAAEWASAPYEHRANLLADIGVEPGSKQLAEIAGKPWAGLTPSEKSRLTEAMKAREKARVAKWGGKTQNKPDAAAPVTTQPPAQAGATEAAAPRVIGKYGRTPGDATQIELRPNADGTMTVYAGKYPMVDYESAQPIVVPGDTTDAQAVKAIKDAKAVTNKDKFYGVKEDAAPVAAAPAAPAPQATPEELLTAAEKRVDGLKALLACLTS